MKEKTLKPPSDPVAGRTCTLRHDDREITCVVDVPRDGDSVWTARLHDDGDRVLCELTGWVAAVPNGLGVRLGLRDHLRLMSAETERGLVGRGYARRLLEEATRVLALPIEPESMWEVIEQYPEWDWLEANRGALSAEALLSPIPTPSAPRRHRRRGAEG